MRGIAKLDAGMAGALVCAATLEAVLRFHATPGRLTLNVVFAVLLAPIAARRTRPMLVLVGIAAAAVVVAAVTHVVWPGAPVEATVGVLAMMLATYSLGAHSIRRASVPLAVLISLVVVLVTNLTSMHGGALVSGVIFVMVFVGAIPALVGRLVRKRARNVERLRHQRERIVRDQRTQRETAVVAERLAVAERLRPELLAGLGRLADEAATGAPAGEIEEHARGLLAITRTEVVALTAEVDPGPLPTDPSPPAMSGRSVMPQWFVLVSLAATWGATDLIALSLGPRRGNLAEAALALGSSLVAGLLLRWPTTVLGLSMCFAGHVLAVGLHDLPGNAAAMAATWTVGLVLRDLDALSSQLRSANRVLLDQADAQAERAVVEERLRIARDLHDALGHTLTVVALQAGAARRIATTDPMRARKIVGELAHIARDGVAAIGSEAPSPGIASLVEQASAAGCAVTGEVADEYMLPENVRAVAYRLVQESLTNVLKHAPGARASVVVRCLEDHVEVEVSNTAPTGRSERVGTGRGLAGIGERVAACSGDVSWGPSADGGFVVRARLPTLEPT